MYAAPAVKELIVYQHGGLVFLLDQDYWQVYRSTEVNTLYLARFHFSPIMTHEIHRDQI